MDSLTKDLARVVGEVMELIIIFALRCCIMSIEMSLNRYKVWRDQIKHRHGHGQPDEGRGEVGGGGDGVDHYLWSLLLHNVSQSQSTKSGEICLRWTALGDLQEGEHGEDRRDGLHWLLILSLSWEKFNFPWLREIQFPLNERNPISPDWEKFNFPWFREIQFPLI